MTGVGKTNPMFWSAWQSEACWIGGTEGWISQACIYSHFWDSPSYGEPVHLTALEFSDAFFLIFFPSVSEKPTEHSNGQQQHCQHSTGQEAGRTAEDGSQHRQDKGKDNRTHTAHLALIIRGMICSHLSFTTPSTESDETSDDGSET